jgi:hypothetical protein
MLSLETKYRVPTVGIHMKQFQRLAESATRVHGVPRLRQAFVPGTLADRSPAELRAFVEGDDPVTGRPFMEGVIAELTRPLEDEDLKGLSFERSTPRLLPPNTEENLRRLFEENRWTDFLPIVLPTEERVAAMLAGTSRGPDEVVGQLRPTWNREPWEFTVEKVAVNAVMAGARPEYLPVILALAASGVTARQSSTSSIASGAVVNGPIRDEIGMNSGTGALGPYNHANATIGRAYGLLSQNLQGGSVPGETFVGSLGNNFTYNNFTFAEAEEGSPWEPLHVSHGFSQGDSAVTPISPIWNFVVTWGVRENWREKLLEMVGAHDPCGGLVLIVDPSAARLFAEREGFPTKQSLADWVVENATKRAGLWWDHFTTELFIRPLADQGIEPWASRAAADPDERFRTFEPGDVEIVVVGGETNNAFAAASGRYWTTVSVDEWR